MDLRFTVNGVDLGPGVAPVEAPLRTAGLHRLPPLRRLLRGLPARRTYWEASDPEVDCFDGTVRVYPCRDGYLDDDRRWGTDCLVEARGDVLTTVEVRVIDGVYAAANLFEQFAEAACEALGDPDEERRRAMRWTVDDVLVFADYRRDEHRAVFRLAARGSRPG